MYWKSISFLTRVLWYSEKNTYLSFYRDPNFCYECVIMWCSCYFAIIVAQNKSKVQRPWWLVQSIGLLVNKHIWLVNNLIIAFGNLSKPVKPVALHRNKKRSTIQTSLLTFLCHFYNSSLNLLHAPQISCDKFSTSKIHQLFSFKKLSITFL